MCVRIHSRWFFLKVVVVAVTTEVGRGFVDAPETIIANQAAVAGQIVCHSGQGSQPIAGLAVIKRGRIKRGRRDYFQ